MKMISNFKGEPWWCIAPYIWKSYLSLENESTDTVLFYGVEWIYDHSIKIPYKNYKRRCLVALWTPCEFMQKNYFHFEHYDFFTDVYCICPFTCSFMNKYYGYDKFKYIPFPFTNYTVNSFGNYDSDICYFGCLHSDEMAKAIDLMRNFKYKFMTSKGNSNIFHPYEFDPSLNYVTHGLLTNEDKLLEISKCKSGIVFNKLYITPSQTHFANNRFFNGIENKAFSHFENKILPQFKSRVMELASCKSIILCKKDPWNLIDDFFEDGKEYISFDTFDDLYDLTKDISNNFSKYENIIESAFLKQKQYTVEKIVEYITSQNQNLINWSLKNVN